ncbi:MAG: hypothetical protein H0T60_18560, partial [Acidobacteria bacterium]|nr:hypothetical protein [Acidobacteriota bacterium]
MPDTPTGKETPDVVEKTCRVVLEVTVRIRQITRESVAGHFTADESGGGLPWEWAERQNRLLLALLKDEEKSARFLAMIAGDGLGLLLESEHVGMVSDEEDELWEEVYAGMGREDVAFFRAARRDGILGENIELIHEAIAVDWKGAEIEEVRVV